MRMALVMLEGSKDCSAVNVGGALQVWSTLFNGAQLSLPDGGAELMVKVSSRASDQGQTGVPCALNSPWAHAPVPSELAHLVHDESYRPVRGALV